jgi:hypothetical protein
MSFSANYPPFRPSLNLNFAREKVLDPRVTFTRASTATYYDGVTTAKAEENLLTYSQQFDDADWGKIRVTVTANTTAAPDGTTTADSVLENTDNNTHVIGKTVTSLSGLTYVISAFVKANGRNYVALYEGVTSKGKFFDITPGGSGAVLGNLIGAPLNASITAVGNDWFRCTIEITASSTLNTSCYISTTGTDFSYTGDVTKGIFLWGAQLEQRSSVSSYTATTTQPITNYIPVLLTAANNAPRFDHNPVTGESLGLLIEESRTNLLLYSEDFSTTWSLSADATLTPNTIVAPNGTLTGDKLGENTANAARSLLQSTSSVAPTAVSTTTVYVKAGERTNLLLRAFDNAALGNYVWANFNLLTGVINNSGNVGNGTGASASITSVGNGWYRCALSGIPNTSGTATRVVIYVATSTANSTNYQGDGYSGIYIWGAQLEAGAFPTSYIATGAATATRSADAASMIGPNFSSWYNQSEGTLFVNATTPPNLSTFPTITSLSDGTANNRVLIYGFTNGYYVGITTGGVSLATAGVLTTPSVGSRVSIAGGIKVNDVFIAQSGVAGTTDTSVTLPVVNRLFIGAGATGTATLNGTISRIAYYPLRLTNAQLQALTKTSTPRTYPATLPSLNLNFARARVLDPRITFTRASTASYFDSAGVLQSAANNVPRFDHDPVTGESLGLLIEEQRTNSIRNNTMAGAVAGTPGTLPTNWTSQAVGGVSITEVIGIGIENGISYVDVKYAGTTSSTATGGILTEGGLIVAASSGQTWASSFFIKLVGGSLAGITSINNNIIERDSGGVLVASTNTVITPTSAALNSQRVSTTRTLNNVSTAFVQQRIAIIPQSGVAVDFTLRIGLPQLELGAFATSVIPTTGSAATRLADTATMTGANFSNWYRQDEGTLFTEFAWVGLRSAAGQRILIVDNGTTTNYWGMVGTSSNTMQNPVVVNGVTEATNGTPATTYSVNTYYKQAVAIAVNNTVAAINGVSGTTDTAALVPTVNTLRLCASSAGVGENIRIRRIAYYPLRLTNAQLQALTS